MESTFPAKYKVHGREVRLERRAWLSYLRYYFTSDGMELLLWTNKMVRFECDRTALHFRL